MSRADATQILMHFFERTSFICVGQQAGRAVFRKIRGIRFSEK